MYLSYSQITRCKDIHISLYVVQHIRVFFNVFFVFALFFVYFHLNY